MGLKLITPATGLAVSLADVKTHLRVSADHDDAYITMLIKAAVGTLEKALNRAIGTQTYRLTLSEWPESGEIVLPNPPLSSVSSIVYVDTDGATQTLASSQYIVNDDNEPGLITPAHDIDWPEVQEQSNAITITYITGYATIPEPLQAAVLLLVGHWYENREAVLTGTIATDLPLAVQFILDEFRVRRYSLP